MRDPTERRTCVYYRSPQWIATNFIVLIVLGLVGWAEYVFVRYITVPMFTAIPALGLFYFIGWHIWVSLLLSSYIRAIFTDPGSVPLNPEKYNVDMYDKDSQGHPRWCNNCKSPKPDRCHHCSTCGTCVLKMDHHCPWVNNCVGFRNYKFFCLFLIYVVVVGFWYCFCAIPQLISTGFFSVDPGALQIVLVFIVCITFALGLTCFGLTHLSFVLRNVTTLESFEKNKTNPYDLGWRSNFEQVFGPAPLLYFLPVRNSIGNGLTFLRSDTVEDAVASDKTKLLVTGDSHDGTRDYSL